LIIPANVVFQRGTSFVRRPFMARIIKEIQDWTQRRDNAIFEL